MPGIPPAQSTDDEDVAWGLQTAEALWKRGERIDALVWLRRAAQAAGDANDDDRALELARFAAELSDWMASGEGEADALHADDAGGIDEEAIQIEADEPVAFADDEASTSPGDRAVVAAHDADAPVGVADAQASDTDRPAHIPSAPPEDVDDDGRTLPPGAPPVEDEDEEYVQVSEEEIELSDEPASAPELPPEHEPSVLPAERVHAGMFNPWDESESAAASPEPAEPAAAATPSESVRVAAPPLPPRPKPPLPSSASIKASAPPLPAASPPAPAEASPPPSAPAEASPPPPSAPPAPPPSVPPPPAAAQPSEPAAVEATTPPSAPPPALELESVDAFADLPDDARDAFARAATIDDLNEGEEVQKFALAYAIEGTFDVAATFVDAPAARVDTGAVLRARGSMGEGVPMRLVCTSKTGRVATWTDAAVAEAFRSIPWVEDDLRAAADRVQTLVGITVGPLGERLDASIRDTIVERLEMRSFTPGERVIEAGEQVPGIVLVGIGELEIVAGDEVKGTVGSGEFLFAGEVLGGGNAPNAVRAGRLGAIALFGDRKIAQELLVTCPPLLEVFAGM